MSLNHGNQGKIQFNLTEELTWQPKQLFNFKFWTIFHGNQESKPNFNFWTTCHHQVKYDKVSKASQWTK